MTAKNYPSSSLISFYALCTVFCLGTDLLESVSAQWDQVRPWQAKQEKTVYVRTYPRADGSGLNAQQAEIAALKTLVKILVKYTGGDFSQVPEPLINRIPICVLVQLDKDVIATLPPSQFERMHKYSDDNSYVLTEMIKLNNREEILRMPWKEMAGGVPPKLYNEMTDGQLGAIPWNSFFGDMPPDVLSALEPRVFASITPFAWSKATAEQLAAIDPQILSSMPINSFYKINPDELKKLPCETLINFPAEKVVAIGLKDQLKRC